MRIKIRCTWCLNEWNGIKIGHKGPFIGNKFKDRCLYCLRTTTQVRIK